MITKCPWPFLEHHKSVFLNVFHVDRFKKFFLSRAQLPNMSEDLSMQEILVAIERIIGCLERLMVEPMNAHPIVDWPLKKTKNCHWSEEVTTRNWLLMICATSKFKFREFPFGLFVKVFSFSPALPLFEKSSARIEGKRWLWRSDGPTTDERRQSFHKCPLRLRRKLIGESLINKFMEYRSSSYWKQSLSVSCAWTRRRFHKDLKCLSEWRTAQMAKMLRASSRRISFSLRRHSDYCRFAPGYQPLIWEKLHNEFLLLF